MRIIVALAITLAAAGLLALHSTSSRARPISATIVDMTAVSGPAVASGAPSGGRTAPHRGSRALGAFTLSAALLGPLVAVGVAGNAPLPMSHYGAYVTSGAISATVTTTATQPVSPTYTLTPTASATAPITFTPGVTATIRPTRTVAPTATVTPTLAPEWGVDALCRCHVPPLPPGSPECERLKAEYVRDVLAAWATQTALVRGTDTPTPTPSDTPVPTATPTLTPIPTDEPTPSPAPTWTPRVIVVTATPVLFPCRLTTERCGTRIFVPFNGKGRRR